MLGLLGPFIGALVSGGFGLLGAQQASSASQRANMMAAIATQQNNEANRAMQAQANALTASQWKKSFAASAAQYKINRNDARQQFAETIRQADQDRQLQKDFAQHGVQWRADDARAAGIHPLAAMGAQLASASPISISGNVAQGSVPGPGSYGVTPGQAPEFQSDNFRGQALANMGQDISRAITATAHEYQRQQELGDAASVLKLDNMRLENQLLQAQIARTRGAGIVGPPMPSGIPTSGASSPSRTAVGAVEFVPAELNPGLSSNRSQEGGSFPSLSYSEIRPGRFAARPSQNEKQAIEDSFYEWEHFAQNRILPTFGINQNPPSHIPLKPGHEWTYHWTDGSYSQEPVRDGPDARNFNWGY